MFSNKIIILIYKLPMYNSRKTINTTFTSPQKCLPHYMCSQVAATDVNTDHKICSSNTVEHFMNMFEHSTGVAICE